MDRKLITIVLIFISLSLSAQLKSGLVGYWKFENNALDATMHDNDGTVSGATYTSSGKVGGCYDFDGSNDYIDSNLSTSYSIFSFSCWYNIAAVGGTTTPRLFDKYYGANVEKLIYFQTDLKTMTFIHYFSNSYGVWRIDDSFTYDTWHHLVITYNNSSISNDPVVYIDGLSKSVFEDISPDGTASTTTDSFVFGNRPAGDRPLDGKIDEVMIYNREISATEVKMLYNSGNGVYFVMQNFKKDKDYEKLNDYMLSRMYSEWINYT